MVAAAKLRRVQERVEKGKPYSQTMADLVGTLAPNVRGFAHPLLQERPVSAAAVVVIAADKGLCGSYNTNILRVGHQFLDSQIRALPAGDAGASADGTPRQPVRLITVGRKATDYFTKRGYDVTANFPAIAADASYDQVRAISNAITNLFLTGQVDEVYICYTEFKSVMSQRPQSVKFLPIEPPAAPEMEETTTSERQEFTFEPNAAELLNVLLPRFVETRVYQLLLESVASEFGARMTAMTNATKNANEQIDSLTLIYNRTRQANITKELLDIVGGAEALRG